MIKRILLVDDERAFLRSLSDGLATFSSLEVLTAHDGEQAVDVLASEPIDLVVTDLQMPGMGGLELLTHMKRQHPRVPVIVMTAFATPTTQEQVTRLQALSCVDKPVDFDELAARIFEALLEHNRNGWAGITVASFLQLANMERMSCRLQVTCDTETGTLRLSEGELAEAKLGELSGEVAAYTMIGWGRSAFSVESAPPVKKRDIEHNLGFIIMESARRADESRTAATALSPDDDLTAMLGSHPPELPGSSFQSTPSRMESPGTKVPDRLGKENKMAIEQLLQGFRDVKGYKASAIMNFTGEALATDSVDPDVDLALVGATFNDIFRAAHEASTKIGLDATREAVFKTPKGLVIMQCSGVNSAVHIHLVVVLNADGNQALAKLKLDQTVPKAMAEL